MSGGSGYIEQMKVKLTPKFLRNIYNRVPGKGLSKEAADKIVQSPLDIGGSYNRETYYGEDQHGKIWKLITSSSFSAGVQVAIEYVNAYRSRPPKKK